MVKETVTKTIKGEMSQLKEDIQSARENNFGRQLFEAFAAEYSNSYMNEKTEVAKLMKQLSDKENELAEASKEVTEKEALIESARSEIRIINDQASRKEVLSEMLNPLAKDKKEIMDSLLESIQTDKLRASFDKYLPAVLNGDGSGIKRKLMESTHTEVTGNREVEEMKPNDHYAQTENVIDIKRLAGL
jgi:chromosome segregation ATPase